MVELRFFPPTSKLHSTHYENDGKLFSRTDEKRMKHFDSSYYVQ